MALLKGLEGTCIDTRYGFAYYRKTLDNGKAQYVVRNNGQEYYFNIDVFDTDFTILGGK